MGVHLPEIAAMLLPALDQAPAPLPLEMGIGFAPELGGGRSTEEYLSSSSSCTCVTRSRHSQRGDACS